MSETRMQKRRREFSAWLHGMFKSPTSKRALLHTEAVNRRVEKRKRKQFAGKRP